MHSTNPVKMLQQYLFGILIVFFITALTVSMLLPILLPMLPVTGKTIFEAKACIMLIAENGEKGQVAGENDKTMQNSAVAILRGNVLREEIINTVGIAQLFPNLDISNIQEVSVAAIRAFQKQCSVTPLQDSTLIQISFQHGSADIALQIVRLMVKIFEQSLPTHSFSRSQQLPLIEKEIALYRSKVEQSEQALSAFKQNNRMYSHGERKAQLAAQYNADKAALRLESEKLQETADRLAVIEEQFRTAYGRDAQGRQLTQSADFAEVRDRHLKLKLYEHELLKKYDENTPLLVDLRQEIKMAAESMRILDASSSGEGGAGEKIVELQALENKIIKAKNARAGQQEKTELIQARLRRLGKKSALLSGQEAEIKDLQKELESNREIYRDFVCALGDGSRENTPAASQQGLKAQLIDKPLLPLQPLRPKQSSFILAGILSGLLCGFLYGILRGWLLRRKPTK